MTSAVPFVTWFAYAGDGSTVTFNFPLRFLVQNEVRVRLISALGVETILVRGTHYSISGVGTLNSGSVTLFSAPAAGVTVILERTTGASQGIDLEDTVKSPANSSELQLDRFAMVMQDHSRDINRSIRRQLIDPATGSLELPLSTGAIGKVLAMGTNGQLIAVENDPAAAEAAAIAAQEALEEVEELIAGIDIQERLRLPRLVGDRTGRYTDVYELTDFGDYLPGAGVSLHNTKLCLHTRSMHRTPDQGVRIADLQVVWGNWWMQYDSPTVFERDGTAPIIIRASIYSAFFGGAPIQLTFDGRAEAIFDIGSNLVSDPLAVEIPPATRFWVTTRAELLDLEGFSSYPVGRICQAAFGEGVLPATNANNDYTVDIGTGYPLDEVDGLTESAIPENNDLGFMPCAIIGRVKGSFASVVLLGDSVGDGFGDFGDPANGLQGHLTRALDNLVPWTKFTRPGHSYLNLVNAANHRRMLSSVAGTYTHVFIQLGTNDLYANARTFLQTQQSILSVVGNFADRGVKVILCTVPPVTTSTDSWATPGNQTISNNPVGANGHRISVNDWIRAGVPGVTAVFDFADIVETSRNSGIWKGGYTSDGVHENTISAAVAGDEFDPELLAA